MALEIQHITKHFGTVTAVRDVSFTVRPGQIFGFLGTNGAGKTTTMRLILDILRPDEGAIRWNGRPNTDVPRRAWGYLPEERGLNRRWSSRSNCSSSPASTAPTSSAPGAT